MLDQIVSVVVAYNIVMMLHEVVSAPVLLLTIIRLIIQLAPLVLPYYFKWTVEFKLIVLDLLIRC